jgi:hypothetical protein
LCKEKILSRGMKMQAKMMNPLTISGNIRFLVMYSWTHQLYL